MRTIITIISLAVLGYGALVAWQWWHGVVPTDSTVATSSPPDLVRASSTPADAVGAATSTTTTSNVTSSSSTTVTESIAVTDLPLTDTQREVLERVGLPVDTMVVTPTMVQCAREKLGVSRYQAMLAGDTPSMLEVARLLPCLGARTP